MLKKRSFRFAKATKLLRRVHMYAGLLMLPWVLLFGISGLLFNHPNLGADIQAVPLTAEALDQQAQLQAWEANAAAQEVVDALNSNALPSSTTHYELDPDYDSHFEGFTVLQAPAPAGRYVALLDLEKPAGVLTYRKAPPVSDDAVFPQTELSVPNLSTSAVAQQLAGLLAQQGWSAEQPLTAHPKIAPSLRLRVVDQAGRHWNLAYHTGRQELSGRASDKAPNVQATQLLGMLHKTHHFPLRFGSRWLWALFADLLGLIMVFWALSGLLMWWQIPKTRWFGLLSLAIALGVAAGVMGGTTSSLLFDNVPTSMGPGN